MKRELEQAEAWLWRWTAVYALQVLFVCVFLLGALHMVNLYPRHYTPALIRRDEALAFAKLCEENPAVRYSTHAACSTAHSDASVNVRLLALERTFGEFLQHFNVLSPLLADSKLSYVLLRSADNILSSSLALLLFLCGVVAWLAWSLSAGPLRTYQYYRLLQQQQQFALQGSHPNQHFVMPMQSPYSKVSALGWTRKEHEG